MATDPEKLKPIAQTIGDKLRCVWRYIQSAHREHEKSLRRGESFLRLRKVEIAGIQIDPRTIVVKPFVDGTENEILVTIDDESVLLFLREQADKWISRSSVKTCLLRELSRDSSETMHHILWMTQSAYVGLIELQDYELPEWRRSFKNFVEIFHSKYKRNIEWVWTSADDIIDHGDTITIIGKCRHVD